MRFLLVGGGAAAVDYSVLWMLSQRLTQTEAFSIAYLTGVLTHFTLNKYWTFRCNRSDLARQILEYSGVVMITYLIQLTGFEFWIKAFHINLYLAKFLAIPPSTLAGFFLLKLHVFKHVPSMAKESENQAV